MHRNQTASNSQLRTEKRDRLKSTTLSTGEDRDTAVPLHRKREAIRKGEGYGRETKRENEIEKGKERAG